MKFADIKVGDWVWIGFPNHRGTGMDRRENLTQITRLTPARMYGARSWEVWTREDGRPFGTGSYRVLSIATPEEKQEWERSQAEKQAEKEEREAAVQKAYEEKCERAIRLMLTIKTGQMPLAETHNGSTTFEFEGHRFRIAETED